jgi:hypothetical protein
VLGHLTPQPGIGSDESVLPISPLSQVADYSDTAIIGDRPWNKKAPVRLRGTEAKWVMFLEPSHGVVAARRRDNNTIKLAN